MAIKPIHLSALNGLLAVGLGAFGAHALKQTLVDHASTDTWKTASLYHLVHAAALLALALSHESKPGVPLPASRRCALWSWLIGSALFCGSLYAMAIGGPKWLGPVTPLGGVAFMAGWAAFLIPTPRPPESQRL